MEDASLIQKNQDKTFSGFCAASLMPIHHLFNTHNQSNPEWCPVKANKSVSTCKYWNINDDKEMFDWLVENVGKTMEGEKLKALHRPFDKQMNEAMSNDVARHC